MVDQQFELRFPGAEIVLEEEFLVLFGVLIVEINQLGFNKSQNIATDVHGRVEFFVNFDDIVIRGNFLEVGKLVVILQPPLVDVVLQNFEVFD